MKTYNIIFTTYNGGIKAINGINAENEEKAKEIAQNIAKISMQPLRFKECVEYKGKE